MEEGKRFIDNSCIIGLNKFWNKRKTTLCLFEKSSMQSQNCDNCKLWKNLYPKLKCITFHFWKHQDSINLSSFEVLQISNIKKQDRCCWWALCKYNNQTQWKLFLWLICTEVVHILFRLTQHYRKNEQWKSRACHSEVKTLLMLHLFLQK